MDIAVLGTGLMGGPMAERLAAKGHRVLAYNRTAAKAKILEASGVRVVDSAAEVLRAATHAILMLSDAEAIREVLFRGEARVALADRTVIQMGTILPGESRQLAKDLAAVGAECFEAPVLGSIPEVRESRLIVMVGGSRAQFETNQALLRCFGPKPVLVGPVGQAAALKLALNQLIATLTTAFAYSLGLVRREGIDVDVFMQLLRGSALYAPTFDKKLQRMLDRDFEGPNFPTKHLLKDVRLMLEQGRRQGLRTDALAGVERILESALADGLAEQDYSALYNAVDPKV